MFEYILSKALDFAWELLLKVNAEMTGVQSAVRGTCGWIAKVARQTWCEHAKDLV